jgi:beta-lactamase regulating signal transducer with metallopeptidase domain
MGAPLIDYLLKVAVCLCATYLFYHFMLRDDVNFLGNRLFLLFMLPLSFLLPLAPLQSPFRSLTFDPAALTIAASMPAPSAHSAPLFASVTVILYWTVAAIFMLRILFHLLHLYRLQRRHPHERLQNITLVRVESPIPPFSFFNRIFLHTQKIFAAREIEQIISHESVHIRQFHSLDILVMELVVALQWFNPVVWFYRKALKETHEYLADREVIAQGFNAEGYRLLLFEQQFGANLFEFASHLKQSQIKRRMYMMNRMKGAGKAPYKIILALPLIALLALALAEPRLIIAQGTPADDKKEVAQKEDKPVMSEQALKEIQIKLDEKAKQLEEKLNAADSPEEKQKLQEELDDLYKKRQVLMTEHRLVQQNAAKGDKKLEKKKLEELLVKFAEKEKFLKQAYSSADNPEKKEKIKQDLDRLFKDRQFLLSENGMAMKHVEPSREQMQKKLQAVQEQHLKLEQLIAAEQDQEKLKELKLKFEELAKFEEELKIRIGEGGEKQP